MILKVLVVKMVFQVYILRSPFQTQSNNRQEKTKCQKQNQKQEKKQTVLKDSTTTPKMRLQVSLGFQLQKWSEEGSYQELKVLHLTHGTQRQEIA